MRAVSNRVWNQKYKILRIKDLRFFKIFVLLNHPIQLNLDPRSMIIELQRVIYLKVSDLSYQNYLAVLYAGNEEILLFIWVRHKLCMSRFIIKVYRILVLALDRLKNYLFPLLFFFPFPFSYFLFIDSLKFLLFYLFLSLTHSLFLYLLLSLLLTHSFSLFICPPLLSCQNKWLLQRTFFKCFRLLRTF